jgi:PAS domain S-box-containing protein
MISREERLRPHHADAIWEAIGQHAIVSISDPTGTIVYVNDKFVNVSGYRRDELLGQNHRLIKSTVQSDEFWAAMWWTISSGQVWHGVVCNRAKNGALYWVDSQISPFFDEAGAITHYVSMRTDITAHVQARADLQQAAELAQIHETLCQRELFLRATLDNLPFLFWFKNAGGQYLVVNQAFAKACKRESPQEVVGLTDLELWPAATAQAYRAFDNEVLQTSLEHTRVDVHTNGQERRWIEVLVRPLFKDDGQILGTVGFSRDITERKQVEILLEEKTELLTSIFDLSPDGFVSFDVMGCVNYVSPAFTRMTGLSKQQIKSLDESKFIVLMAQRCTAETRSQTLDGLRQLLLERRSGQCERMVLAVAGQRVIEVRQRSGQGGVVSQILCFHDVTHEVEVERTKTEFLTTAAHELRTPMVSIYGFAEILQALPLDQAICQECLDIVLKQSQRMIAILNDLLELSAIDSRHGKDFVFEPVQVQGLLDDVMREFKLPLGKLPPAVGMPGKPMAILADQNRLRQALVHVLANAYKFAKSRDHVSIVVKQADSGVAISVIDQGIGMTAEQVQRVGERFYRADASGKVPGTGLGMSIVKEIMALHGGSVRIQSTPGRGTTVTLLLTEGRVAGTNMA